MVSAMGEPATSDQPAPPEASTAPFGGHAGLVKDADQGVFDPRNKWRRFWESVDQWQIMLESADECPVTEWCQSAHNERDRTLSDVYGSPRDLQRRAGDTV